MSERWTIGELAEHAAAVLRAQSRDGALNGRVREVPGERLIRWYTTIGIVDPPLSRRGRVALYGRRHLLQLVAIKRLQAAGRSIAEIQVALAGATDAMLESLARLPATSPAPTAPAAPLAERPGAPVPDQPDGPVTDRVDTPMAAAAEPPRPVSESGSGPVATRKRFWAAPVTAPLPSPAPPSPVLVNGVRLAPGVTLVLEGAGRTPSPDDIAAILTAAAPLLAVLDERGLRTAPATDRFPLEGST